VNIIIPHVQLHPLLPQLLSRYGHAPTYIDVSASSDAYWNLLNDLWQKGETFILVEHDILPWPGALEELWQCPGLWCANSYDQRGIGIYHSFGCTKFSAELIRRLPDVWSRIGHHWSRLDSEFEWQACQAGLRPHPHRPPVIHLHDYSEVEARES
jgi:hypothetical protein